MLIFKNYKFFFFENKNQNKNNNNNNYKQMKTLLMSKINDDESYTNLLINLFFELLNVIKYYLDYQLELKNLDF